jgi:hypothetical protein
MAATPARTNAAATVGRRHLPVDPRGAMPEAGHAAKCRHRFASTVPRAGVRPAAGRTDAWSCTSGTGAGTPTARAAERCLRVPQRRDRGLRRLGPEHPDQAAVSRLAGWPGSATSSTVPARRGVGPSGTRWAEHVGSPDLRVDVVQLGRHDEAVEERRSLTATIRADEELNLAQGQAVQRPLRRIVDHAQACVVEDLR